MVVYWIIFAIVIPLVPLALAYTFAKYGKLNERSEKEKQAAGVWIVKITLYFWLLDLFYMSCFMGLFLWKYIFGITIILFLFVNLTNSFLAQSKISKWTLLMDFLMGVGLSAYLIYIIPVPTLQTVVLAIVAAVYGGLLTLVGVAWTIKDSNNKRLEDFKRAENDRKEEERKKNIPYVRMDFTKELPPLVVNAGITKGLDWENADERARLNKRTYYCVMIKDFQIKNIANANIIMNGVVAFGRFHKFSRVVIVEPGARCLVKTTNNYAIAAAQPEQSIFIVVSDTWGNQYKIECHLCRETGGNVLAMSSEIEGEEYVGFDYSCAVSDVDLPVLLTDNYEAV